MMSCSGVREELFAKVGEGEKNSESDATRRCQLTALILAECMSLWSTTIVHARDDGDQEWIASHPFLSNALLPSILSKSWKGKFASR
jgi:hypothetical protein